MPGWNNFARRPSGWLSPGTRAWRNMRAGVWRGLRAHRLRCQALLHPREQVQADRLERNGVHENVASYTVAEQMLHIDQIGRAARADFSAMRIHEIEQHGFSAEQILIQADCPALVRYYGHVRNAGGRGRGYNLCGK